MKYLRNQWDRAGAWLCVIAGAVALVVGYFGVSMAGLFLLGLGALLWVSADLRDEWRKLDAIDRHLLEAGTLPQAAAASIATRPVLDGTVVPQGASLR